MKFMILIIFVCLSKSLHESNSKNNKVENNITSCNMYVSSRLCRPCFMSIEKKLANFDYVDTLYIITEYNNILELDNLHRILSRSLRNISVRDTIYANFQGNLYSESAKTLFEDSCLNALFNKSTPILFRRTNGCTIEFFGT